MNTVLTARSRSRSPRHVDNPTFRFRQLISEWQYRYAALRLTKVYHVDLTAAGVNDSDAHLAALANGVPCTLRFAATSSFAGSRPGAFKPSGGADSALLPALTAVSCTRKTVRRRFRTPLRAIQN